MRRRGILPRLFFFRKNSGAPECGHFTCHGLFAQHLVQAWVSLLEAFARTLRTRRSRLFCRPASPLVSDIGQLEM